MNALTIDQALQSGIEAYENGHIQKADHFYTAILKVQPKHPDANHNMGVLAVDIGKIKQAISFFKTALEANPNTAQFWFSYIDALIKLERLADAWTVFDQAKSKGIKGDDFDKLEQKLKQFGQKPLVASKIVAYGLPLQPNILDSLKLDQALGLAKRKVKNGDPDKARLLYKDILARFPKNKRAIDGFKGLVEKSAKKIIKIQDAPNDELQSLMTLYTKGQLALVVERTQTLTEQYPDDTDIWNLMGASTAQIGQLEQAIFAFKRVLAIKPNDANAHNNIGNALRAWGKLEKAIEAYNKALAIKPDHADAHYNMGNALKEQGKLEEAIEAYNKALAIKPDHADAHYNMGATLKEQGKLEEAIEAFNQALAIKPDYADAYYNMGNAQQQRGDLEKAIEAYDKALAIKPDYADAHNNMGNALKAQFKLEEATVAYTKALAIKPGYADTYYNMGNALQEQGKLEKAIKAYNKALVIKPDYAEAIENSLMLAVQLLPVIANYSYDFATNKTQVHSEAWLRPMYQIQFAIKAYLEADFNRSVFHNNNFKACDENFYFEKPDQKDKIFCNAYSNFIGRLLDATWDVKPDTKNKVYHLGESHCLSYAHRNITIDASNFRITPRITFGAKAFHFSRAKKDNFQEITKAHLVSLPQGSKVFLSYGEIDCRPNEGFISAARKRNKPLKELINQTTEGYVQWFLSQNQDLRHRLYFINVPAPVYDKKLSAELNLEVARTVKHFNAALNKYTEEHGFDIVDVFKFTAGKDGFSNRFFHIDNFHLGAKAITEIEQQLS